jgi:sugar lactone lactonase YvrE
MTRNLLPRTCGRSSAALSSSALISVAAKTIATIRSAVHPALLFALGWTLCGGAAQAQTAYFGGAQTTLASSLASPSGAAVDASGDVFYTLVGSGSVGVYEIPAGCTSSSCIKAIATSSLSTPEGLAIDASGNLYVADSSNGLLKLTLSSGSYSSPSTIANNSSSPALANPWGVAVDAGCNIYVSDKSAGNVYKYTPGSGGCSASSYTNSTTVATGLTFPEGVAVDASGSVYVASSIISGAVYKYTVNGNSYTQSIVAGTGLTDPSSVTVDALGNVYVGSYQALSRYAPNGSGGYVETSLGSGFNQPYGAAVDNKGDLYVADLSNNSVYEIQTQGVNFGSTAVGTASSSLSLIFNFTNATAANISAPVVLTQGATGQDFAASGGTCSATTSYSAGGTSSCTVNVTVKPAHPGLRTGAVKLEDTAGTVIATAYVYGTGTGPQVAFLPGVQSTLQSSVLPYALAMDGAGNYYTGNAGIVTTYPSNTSVINLGTANIASTAVDGGGNLFVTDDYNGVAYEYVLNSTGSYTQVTLPTSSLQDPFGIAVDGSGNVYMADARNGGGVYKFVPNGSGGYTQSTVASSLNIPNGVAVDASGSVYVAAKGGNAVYKYTPDGSGAYTQSTVASSGLSSPVGVAVDLDGNIYVANVGDKNVIEYAPSGGSYTEVGMVGSSLSDPISVTVDAGGNIYIGDVSLQQVLKIDVSDAPSISFATTVVGSTSSDSPKTVTVANIGNAPLTIESAPAVATNFALNSTNTCTTANSPVTAGSTCALALEFTPTEAGAPLTGTAILTDNNLNATAPSYATQTIDMSGTTPAATSTAVASSANPSTTNQAVTFTATVTNTSSGASSAPTGTVQFQVDGTNSGTPVSLTAGTTTSTASLQLSNLTVSGSPHTITANYLNLDGNFTDSNGSLTGGQTVNAATATLSGLTVTPATVPINTSAAFTVTLNATTVTPVKPAGTVTFSEPVSGGSTITLCTATLSSSAPYTASCSSKALSGPTPATVNASYTDTNGNFTVSTPATTTVALTQVTTSLALYQNSSGTPTVDAPTILKAVLTVGSSSPNAPKGTISFTANGVGIPGCSGTSAVTLTTIGSVYGAQCTTSTLTAPSASIGATYSGDNNFANATASALSLTVNEAKPVFTITAAPVSGTSIIVNSPVNFTAAFSAPNTPTQPKGSIVLTQGSTPLCTITDVTVSLMCPASATAFPNAGTFTITAAYTDANTSPQFLSETYSNSKFTVTAGSSNTAVALTSGTAGVNQTATFTATVTSTNSGASTPQGSVTFQVTDPAGRTATICSPNVTLTSGSATCPYTFALSGGYSVKVTYNPNPANFVTSFGTTSVTSIPDPTTLTVGAATPASPVVNQTYTLTATVKPTFPATGAGVSAPTGGSVSFYPSASSTTALCKGPVTNTGTSAAPVYTASCITTTSGSVAAGSYTISATYTDSASVANFVPSSNTATLVIQPDTPTVTPTASSASIQVNQPLTLSVTVKPSFSGPFTPTGQVALMSGSTTLCTATLSSSTGNSEAGSCSVPYLDLQVASSPYTITPVYKPDTAGSVNFKNPTNAPTNPSTASVMVTPDTTAVQVTPSVTPGILGYASQTITYTVTITPSQPVSTSSTATGGLGVLPTGSITLQNTSGLPFIPPQGATNTCGSSVTIPSQPPFTIQCSVMYPLGYIANNNTDTVTAAYVPASAEKNFTGSSLALNEPVKNFTLAFTTGTGGTVGSVVVTPGFTNTTDPIVPNQTVASLSTSSTASGIGLFTDTLAYTCTVTSASGVTSNLPTCVPVPPSGPPSTTPVAYTVIVPSGASPGQYTINVSAADPTNAPTLIHTLTEPLNVVDTATQPSYSFSGAFVGTESVSFGAPASFTPAVVWCSQIKWTGSGTLPAGLTTNPFTNYASQPNIVSAPPTSGSSPTYLTCALGSSSKSGPALSINITPCAADVANCGSGQAAVTVANKAVHKSHGASGAMALAMPVFILLGWFGRNRARKSFFKMMTLLLLAWGALSVSGCGGGYTLKTPGSSSAATVLPVGTYQVLVAAQDASNNTYYAVVTVSVI